MIGENNIVVPPRLLSSFYTFHYTVGCIFWLKKTKAPIPLLRVVAAFYFEHIWALRLGFSEFKV